MKFALIVFSCSLAAFAQNKQPTLDEGKAMIQANLDKQITNLQAAKSCVSSATSQDALKKCRQQLKESKDALNKENKAKRMEQMKKRAEMMNKGRKPKPKN